MLRNQHHFPRTWNFKNCAPHGAHNAGSVQILSHIRSGDGFGLHDLRLIERPHVHVAFGGPCSAGDVAQPRGCQVEARLAVRECSNDTGSAANLFHDPLERIIGADLLPVDVREVAMVGQFRSSIDRASGPFYP